MKKLMIEKSTMAMTVLLSLIFAIFTVATPAYAQEVPHLANAMWVEFSPSTTFDSSTPVGTKFNVTIYFNNTTPANAWQFTLVYTRTCLRALRCAYTGDGKSVWSGTLPVDTVVPTFEDINSTIAYVSHGEVLKSSAESAGVGSLGWVEFNITNVPDAGTTLTDHIMLGIPAEPPIPFDCYAMDKEFNNIPLSFYSVDFTIPEFPLTMLLGAFLALTTIVVAVLSRKTWQICSKPRKRF